VQGHGIKKDAEGVSLILGERGKEFFKENSVWFINPLIKWMKEKYNLKGSSDGIPISGTIDPRHLLLPKQTY